MFRYRYYKRKAKNYREFFLSDVIEHPEENSHPARRYSISWTLEHYGEWLREYHEGTTWKYPANGISAKDDVFNALYYYAGYGYQHMKPEMNVVIAREMQEPIAKIPDDIVLYRSTYSAQLSERINKDIRKGRVITISGFISTTLIRETISERESNWHEDVLIKIYCSHGTRGLYLDFFSHRDEHEMLLDGNQRFFVLDSKKKEGKFYIDLISIPD